jgi:hypothetical protein
VRKPEAYFEQVPIEVVEKILAKQNTPAEQAIVDAATAAAPVAAIHEFPAAPRVSSHRRKTSNAAVRARARKGSK